MKKINLVFLFTAVLPLMVYGQDVHFSFPEYSPLLLNPALAGANYAMEGNVNYRNQWSSLGEAYKTTAASFHARINSKNTRKTNHFALGLQVMNDKAGLPGITGNSVAISFADHVMLSRESKVGVGLSVGYVQRAITDFNGQWASQYDGTSYNAGLASGEQFTNPIYGFADIAGGIVYTYQHRNSTLAKRMDRFLSAGVSASHVNRPGNSFLANGNDRLPVRYSAFVNGEIALAETDFSVVPGIWYHRQGPFSQLLFGSSVKIILIPETRYTGFYRPLSLAIGLFGRLNDAAIVRLAVDYDHYSFGYAFDFNTSGLNDYTGGRGSQELFLRYSFTPSRSRRQ